MRYAPVQRPANRDTQVRADLVATIYSHIPRSSLGVIAGALTVAWGMWGRVGHIALLTWLGSVGCVLVWRICLYRAFPTDGTCIDRIDFWECNWTLSTAVHGTVWGSSAFLMYIPGSPELQAFLLVALFAISTAAVPLIGRHLPSLYAFVLPVLLPMVVRLAIEGGAERLLLVIFSVLVMYGIFLFGAEQSRTIRESLSRRYENVDLIEQLKHQTADAEEARKEADRANLMKTRFLAAASHDLRQPMHALGLFSDSLRRRISDPEQHALADRICQSVEGIEQTFDALLDISRLDAGVVQAKTEVFGLQELFDRLSADCAAEAASKGIELRFRRTRLSAYSDPVLVEQVVRNLVNNAIRYTDHGGVLVACRRCGPSVRVEVWDTGIGIPDEKRERIFDEFYQAADRDRREGLGLGLAIVRRVTQLLDAKLDVHSVEGRGSAFKVQLPRGVRTIPSISAARAENSPTLGTLAGKVVLVIDDDPSVRDAMDELLRGWGVRAVKARSLLCALDRLPECERYPDAIVSDFRLGDDHNGIEAVERLRHELGVSIPALIVTGDTAPKSLRAIQASGIGCLPKPVTADRLLLELSRLLMQSEGNVVERERRVRRA